MTKPIIELDFRVKIIRFYPYESVQLNNRIVSSSNNEVYKRIKREIKDILEQTNGIPVGYDKEYCTIQWDNNITFAVQTEDGQICYIQFYDNSVIIGLSISKRNKDPLTHYIKIEY